MNTTLLSYLFFKSSHLYLQKRTLVASQKRGYRKGKYCLLTRFFTNAKLLTQDIP